MTSSPAFLPCRAVPLTRTPRTASICQRHAPLRLSARTTRASLGGRRKQDVQRVNPETGDRASSSTAGTEIVELFVDLPSGAVPTLGVSTSRSATAVIFVRSDILSSGLSSGAKQRAVVFLHGFSQRPRNYATTLRLLAAQGHIVIAPRVWVLDIAFPWTQVPGSAVDDSKASPPAKLQTALLIDAFRSLAALEERFAVGSFALVGHSMGGAMALVAARAAAADARLSAVAVLAPAVGPTEITPLNKLLSGQDGGDFSRFFDAFGDQPVLCLHGKRDAVVPTEDVDAVFTALAAGRAPGALALRGEIVQGNHVGFEDSVQVDLPFFRIVDILLFKLLDALIFGPFALFYNEKQQLELTKMLLPLWIEAATDGATNETMRSMVDALGITSEQAELTWDGTGTVEKDVSSPEAVQAAPVDVMDS